MVSNSAQRQGNKGFIEILDIKNCLPRVDNSVLDGPGDNTGAIVLCSHALRAQVDALRVQVESFGALLNIVSPQEVAEGEERCNHEGRQDVTTMGSEKRRWKCPDPPFGCGEQWEE